MEMIKQLAIDLPGIKGIITDYIDDSFVENIFNQLFLALDKKDSAALQYCLRELKHWYTVNIESIRLNDFPSKQAEHSICYNKVIKYAEELKDYEFPNGIEYASKFNTEEAPVIFVSHRSSDKKYGDALEKLLIGLGVHNKQIIYTSHPLHKIPLDANIYDYLRNNIRRDILLIIIWSNAYLESPACLNEMGAAWVVQCDYSNLYVPDFAFGNPKYHECAVDTRKMGAVLNGDAHCKQNMIELKNKVQKLFKLEDNEANTAHYLDQFIKEISEAK